MSRFTRALRGAMLTCLAALASANALAAPTKGPIDESDLLPVGEAFAINVSRSAPDRVAIDWQVADGYYLYRERIKLETAAATGPAELPPGEPKSDEFFGDVEIYRGAVHAELPVDPAAGIIELAVTDQGCADLGVCYPPRRMTLSVAALNPEAAAVPPVRFGDNPLSAALAQRSSVAAGGGETLPLPAEAAFGFDAIALDAGQLLLRFTPAPGYYLYRDRSAFSAAPSTATVASPQWPPGAAHRDEHFGNVVVYFDQVEVPLPLAARPADAFELNLTATFQGCQTDGICYPPMTRTVVVAMPAADTEAIATIARRGATVASATTSTDGIELAEDQRLVAALTGTGRLTALLTFFGLGVLLAFTPCVLPMIPILSGIIAGAGVIGSKRAFVLSVVYVLASALVFTIAGVLAGLAGQNLAAAFQHPAVLIAFALVFIALALAMFGGYQLQLPGRWQSALSGAAGSRGGSLPGAFVMGALSALIVGPCVAPPLAAAVLYIAQTGDPVFGGAALFTLALGMGVPLVIFGTAVGHWLPKAGGWMESVKKLFGVLFLGLAWWMLERILPPSVAMLLAGMLLIGVAVSLRAIDPLPAAAGWPARLGKAAGVVLLALGLAELAGAAAGAGDPWRPLRGFAGGGGEAAQQALVFEPIKTVTDLDQALAAAAQAGQPVLLDFYADWCVSCKEMERFTFTAPEVVSAGSPYRLLKADVTANDAADQALLARFGLIGPPATLFFAAGTERRSSRLIGFEAAAGFAARLRKAAAAP